jgi:hypothetical protein
MQFPVEKLKAGRTCDHPKSTANSGRGTKSVSGPKLARDTCKKVTIRTCAKFLFSATYGPF